MLMIRLARFGKKKQPFYRIVVSEKMHTPRGKKVEYIGTYDPKSKELNYERERMEYWLSQGAGYSRTIGMILIKEGILKKEDMPSLYLVEKKRKKKKGAEKEEGEDKPAGEEASTAPAKKEDTHEGESKEEEKQAEVPKEEPVKEEKPVEPKVEEKKEEVNEDKPTKPEEEETKEDKPKEEPVETEATQEE